MKSSLNEKILCNILNELNMAKAKRSALKQSNLPCDKVERRIEVLEKAKRLHEISMLKDAIKGNK